MKKLIAAVLGALILTGCVTRQYGAKFDMAALDELQPGQTTIEQAKERLGEPASVIKQSNGLTVLKWFHYQGGAAGTTMSRADVLFDAEGKMMRVARKTNMAGG